MSTIRLVIDVEVHDEGLLREYAERRVREAWQESLDVVTDDSLPQIVLEALVLSNENPSPDVYGLEIVDYHAEVS